MSNKLLTALFAACLFALIVTGKWTTFDRYGSPMPDWDQWDAEAMETYLPWFTKDRVIHHLLNAHNEHRVILTKLQHLSLVLLNGQWDARLEAATNAAIHAAIAITLWLLGARIVRHSSAAGSATAPPSPWFARGVLAMLFLVALALFAVPVAWQNVLAGFHSQQFWLVGFSLATILALPFARAWSTTWWIGAFSAVLVLGSMGSGFLASIAVLIVLGYRWMLRELTFREALPSLVVAFACVAIGVLTRVEVEFHAELKAKSAHDFIFSLIHSLQWPWRERDWAAAVLWLPWLLLALRAFRPAAAKSLAPFSLYSARAVLALGGWVLLQLAATAYARGAGADYPASRYMDTLTFAAMVNAVALLWLLVHRPAARRLAGTISLTVIALGWLATFGFGIYSLLSNYVRYEIADTRRYTVKAEGNLRRFLVTNDPIHFANGDVPFPTPEGLIARLEFPSIRAIMGVPVRPPLAISSAARATKPGWTSNNGIHADHPPRRGLSPTTPPLDYTPTWGSHAEAGPGGAATGLWKSAPLESPLGAWLKFEVAGDLGRPGESQLSLALEDARTGAHLAEITPDRPAGDSWRSAYVRVPQGPFVIVARDDSTTSWFAFSPPVEMGKLSYLAWQANKHGFLLFRLVAGFTVLLALGLAVRSLLRPAPLLAKPGRA